MTLTATAEPETAAPPPPLAERPVFAAMTPARPRALKIAGRVTAGLVALWLVALVLGTFGFGPVAGIGLPRIGGGDGGDSKPQREAAHRTQPPTQHVTKSGVTLTARHGGRTGALAHRPGKASGSSRRDGTRRSPSSQPSHGGSRHPSQTPGASGGGSGATTQAPAAANTPVSPTTSTTTTNPNANQTHSQATPPGSSSTAPGSRSNASNAPGREQSASSPTPGGGRNDHAPPKG